MIVMRAKRREFPEKKSLFATHSCVSLTKLLSSLISRINKTTTTTAMSVQEICPITKLPPAKDSFDIDYNDNQRQYVRLEDSEELRQFFADVRSLCLSKISKDPELYYPQDVEKLQHQEWTIRRFMAHHKGDRMHSEDAQKTSDTIIKMMQWKRSMNLRELKPNEYPREFFQLGLYGQAVTRNGEFLIHCTAGLYKRDAVLTPHIKELVHCMLEKIDNELNGRRVVIFVDLSGIPLRNADIGIIYYFTLVALNYYRRIVKRCIVYEPPWYLSPFISFILAISPRYKALMTRVDKNNLFDVLAPEDIPESLGGKLKTRFDPPEGCPSGREYATRRNIKQKDLIRCLQLYGFECGEDENGNEEKSSS